MTIKTVNPFTFEEIGEYNELSEEEVDRAITKAHNAYLSWKTTSLDDRIKLIRNLAVELRKSKDVLTPLMTKEMGKPINQGDGEIEKSAWTAEVYADNVKKWLEEEVVTFDGIDHKIVFEPLGVILAVMPWNFPVWQFLRFAIPTLLIGNTAVLKHSNLVPGCAIEIQNIFDRAGFPEGVFTTLIVSHRSIERILASDYVQGVSLTGSTEAGAKIAEIAGRNLKRVVLELGGSDPFIVCEDVDIDYVVKKAVLGRTRNNGQSCDAAKRFIVHKSISEEFGRKLAEEFKKLKVGDPADKTVDIGPLANKNGYEEVSAQIQDAVSKGGKAVSPEVNDPKGYTVAPTVILNATKEMRVVKEEVFGPVAPVISFSTDEEAIKLANDSEYGLGGSVWTKDLRRGERIARQLECGTALVNATVRSDPRLPFGGVKKSGLGRELSGYGIKEFANIKALSVYTHGST